MFNPDISGVMDSTSEDEHSSDSSCKDRMWTAVAACCSILLASATLLLLVVTNDSFAGFNKYSNIIENVVVNATKTTNTSKIDANVINTTSVNIVTNPSINTSIAASDKTLASENITNDTGMIDVSLLKKQILATCNLKKKYFNFSQYRFINNSGLYLYQRNINNSLKQKILSAKQPNFVNRYNYFLSIDNDLPSQSKKFNFGKSLFVDKQHKYMYCSIQKVASSKVGSLFYYYSTGEQDSTSGIHNKIGFPKNHGFKFLVTISHQDTFYYHLNLNSYTKFAILRFETQ